MGDNGTSRWIWIVGAFVAGLLIGWFLFGWLLFPVTYPEVPLSEVRTVDQGVYLQSVAQAYQTDPNQALAVQRLQLLGTQAEVEELMGNFAREAQKKGDIAAANQIYALATALGMNAGLPLVQATPAVPQTTVIAVPTVQPATGTGTTSSLLPALLGIGILGAGIALALWLLTRRKPTPAPLGAEDYPDSEAFPAYREGEFSPEPIREREVVDSSMATTRQATAAPVPASYRSGLVLQEFTATFIPGDASYDETFSIDAPGGGYLGECGMTFSEMLNGDPNRIPAVEVWLFDKSDIRTVTKVLMSDYAYGNPGLREKLAPRGDAILARPGQGFVLDAQTLRLEGEIDDLDYLEAEGPARSAFRELTVTMRVSRQAL
jgi:hypothetical protein